MVASHKLSNEVAEIRHCGCLQFAGLMALYIDTLFDFQYNY